MKNIIPAVVMGMFLYSCYPSTRITGTWKNPDAEQKTYASIYVATLTRNAVARATVENAMHAALEQKGVRVAKSMDDFSPGIRKDSLTKQELVNRTRDRNMEGILIISLLRKQNETRYVPGPYGYAPYPRFGFYYDFWGYYNYWYPYIYAPGYYTDGETYYMESNLYDLHSDKLVWSAQSETYDPATITSFAKEFASVIVTRLNKDGLIGPRTKDGAALR